MKTIVSGILDGVKFLAVFRFAYIRIYLAIQMAHEKSSYLSAIVFMAEVPDAIVHNLWWNITLKMFFKL